MHLVLLNRPLAAGLPVWSDHSQVAGATIEVQGFVKLRDQDGADVNGSQKLKGIHEAARRNLKIIHPMLSAKRYSVNRMHVISSSKMFFHPPAINCVARMLIGCVCAIAKERAVKCVELLSGAILDQSRHNFCTHGRCLSIKRALSQNIVVKHLLSNW
jgi:hypothetical protein